MSMMTTVKFTHLADWYDACLDSGLTLGQLNVDNNSYEFQEGKYVMAYFDRINQTGFLVIERSVESI